MQNSDLLNQMSLPVASVTHIVSLSFLTNRFYYYPLTRGSEFEEIPMHLHVYVSTGADFPGTLSWSYSIIKHATAFSLGQLPLQMQQSYRVCMYLHFQSYLIIKTMAELQFQVLWCCWLFTVIALRMSVYILLMHGILIFLYQWGSMASIFSFSVFEMVYALH